MRVQFVGAYCIRPLFAAILGFSLCFAQEAPPERLAVYVSGTSDAGVNKSLGGRLLAAMSQSGVYAEIPDPAIFQDELAKGGNVDLASIVQAAKRHGADYVCDVSITEVFGTHSIAARLVRTSDSQIAKTGLADRPLKSLDDLAAVSSELARQLLPSAAAAVPLAAFAPPPDTVPSAPPPEAILPAQVAAQKQCERTYNINELLFKIKEGFPSKLKDCSSTLAKDMLNPFGKKLEPKSFMMQCPIDGIKKELPDGFPNVDKILGSVTNFVQGIMNTAMAGGTLDPKKLVSTVASMDILGLLSDVRKLASAECVVDEPYEPPPKQAESANEGSSSEAKDDGGTSFGIRIGINFSHTYAEFTRYGVNYVSSGNGNYGNILGMQAGFVLDIAATDVFHIQPGLMYIQKGMKDGDGSTLTSHNIELPLLFSLKFSALRLNAGPYFGYCVVKGGACDKGDIGLSTGIGFDIGMFYIGTFYEYGFFDVSRTRGYDFYNRTLGLNLGVNL